MKSICRYGPLHGKTFAYSGPSNSILCHPGKYIKTTEIDAEGRAVWLWKTH